MHLSNEWGNWYGLGRESLRRTPSCNQHLSPPRKERLVNCVPFLKGGCINWLLICVVVHRDTLEKVVHWTSWISHVPEMRGLFSGAEGLMHRLFCEACLAFEGFVQDWHFTFQLLVLRRNTCHFILTLKWVPACLSVWSGLFVLLQRRSS